MEDLENLADNEEAATPNRSGAPRAADSLVPYSATVGHGLHHQLIEEDPEDDQSDTMSMLDDDDFSIDGLDDDDISEAEAGNTPGASAYEAEIIITQPALDDVAEDFFPCDEYEDEDHLDSHAFGSVYASSGLRRTTYRGLPQEVDWALIKLRSERQQSFNVIAGGKRYCSAIPPRPPRLANPVCRARYKPREDLYPHRIARSSPADLADLRVHCFGRTSGLEQGRILPTMQFCRFPGRSSFSRSWSVVGGFGVGGDSGAWVVDNVTGRVCGHVLAWSDALNRAYISPMDMMLDDMKRVLGASRICLPGGENEIVEDPAKVAVAVSIAEGDELGERLGRIGLSRSMSHRLLTNHLMLSGSPPHMEREWASRRAALGQTASALS
ncbi:hypothetical protein MRB53_039295 [Persea americana]|nr:hypothetical protein MRB53_039295 [Persea americana]